MRSWVVSFLLVCAGAVDAQSLQFAELGECELESGKVIERCRVGYRVIGERNTAGDNVVLFPTWFGGTSEALVEVMAGGLVDTSRYQVVLIDALANGVSSSPSNNAAADSEFPVVTIQDMVDTQHRLATEVLGLDSVHAVVGISMGGMQTYEWGVRYPQFMQRLVPIIGSPRLGAYDIALWHSNLKAHEWFRSCQCADAIELMNAIGVLIGSTRGKIMADTSRGDVLDDIASRAASSPLSVSTSWNTTRQLQAMMRHDISNSLGDTMSAAADTLVAPLLSIVAGTDHVVVPEPAIAFADTDDSQVLVLDTPCGHGAVRCVTPKIAQAVNDFLDTPQ
ncbi:MAG: alpha/beta fold hydrolase [Pseudomonadota bacterium]